MIKATAPPSEFSVQFLQGMVDRMAVSFHKYGEVRDAVPYHVDALASAQDRIGKYGISGNTEFLIDAANFLMMEFMYPSKENAYYEPTDDVKSPGRINTFGARTHRRNDEMREEDE